MSRDLAYLLDILDAARLVQKFAQGVDRVGLAKDTMRQYAILHAIQIIGEAARRVSDEFGRSTPKYHGETLLACGIGWFISTTTWTLM